MFLGLVKVFTGKSAGQGEWSGTGDEPYCIQFGLGNH